MREVVTIRDEDAAKLADEACVKLFEEIKGALEADEEVVVSLCGGRSVQPFYKKIPEYAEELSKEEWERIHFFMTDERRVSIASDGSNFKLASDLFLKELGKKRLLLEANVHIFFGGAKDIESELQRYNEELEKVSNGTIHIPVLGVGEDGHIGALYPSHELLSHEEQEYLLLEDSPKPPPKRMTLSPEHVKQSQAPFLFFIGEAKKEAYQCFKDGKDPVECPCRLAKHGEGRAYVFTDLE